MIVYVLFHETNTGRASDESNGYVEGVYASNAAAEAAKLKALRRMRDAAGAIFWDPDGLDDQAENDAWEHDWRVEAHELVDPSETFDQ